LKRTLKLTVLAAGNDLTTLLTNSRDVQFSSGSILIMKIRPQGGFVLIELVATLVLIGIIGVFAGLFLYTGINGYIASKRNSETALAAQVALDRISAELRRIASLPTANPPVANVSITYLSKDLPGTRRIRYDSGAGIIYFTRDGVEYPLLDKVATFSLTWDSANWTTRRDEISTIRIGFTVTDVGTQFNARIHPRFFIPKPS
jgi:prepilin-type N-terminal cleavage/methylation domain-containing protein